MTIILFACLSFSVYAGGNMPATEKAVAVELRLSEGWWVRINQNGAGSYGFGVLMARVRVMQGTFAFEDVLDEIKRGFPRKPKNSEEPYMAVSYWEKGSSSAEEHPLAKDEALLAKLFIAARANTVPPANETEKSWHDQIEEFWKKHPPISPNKPDAGAGK